MSDDDREPPSDPYESPESEPGGERTMTYFGATGWALLTTLLFLFLLLLIVSIRSAETVDLITIFGLQLVSTLVGVFCILRFYVPDVSIRYFLGFRNTHVGFYILGGALGCVMQTPASALYDAILKRFPIEGDADEVLLEALTRGTSWRIAVFVILVLAGPLLEEVFYRGALYRPLKKNHEAWGIVLVTSVLFAIAHLEKQMVLPIAMVGIAMGILRSVSGSLVPSIIMHATFNGLAFWAVYKRLGPTGILPPEPAPPMKHVIVASVLALVFLALVVLLGERSKVAREAQHEDAA
jgi:uncharacterized protein